MVDSIEAFRYVQLTHTCYSTLVHIFKPVVYYSMQTGLGWVAF